MHAERDKLASRQDKTLAVVMTTKAATDTAASAASRARNYQHKQY